MKQKTNSLILAACLLASITTFTSCEKGEQGPAGKDGTNGLNGINGTNGKDGQDGKNGTNGTNGSNGTNGKDGNANVIGTNPFTVSGSQWQSSSGGTYGTFYSSSITVAAITQSVADKGIVMCYYQLTTDTWMPLPYDDFSYFFVKGGMAILYDYDVHPGTRTFRVVCISPTNLQKHPDLNVQNYLEVKRVLNIQD